LTEEERRLREKAFGMGLFDACGLTERQFAPARESAITVRNYLVKAIQE